MIDIKAPDGSIVRFPDGTPDATIEGVMRENYGGPKSQPTDLAWSDVPGMALQNTPESAMNFGKAMVQPFIHPLDTLQSVGDLGAGALREGARRVLPSSVFNAIEGADPNPAAAERASQTAGAVGDFYKNRYGSMEGFKRALATDPVGVAGDAATVLTGGEAAAARIPGTAGKVASKAVGAAANAINPLTVVGKGAQYANAVTGPIAKTALGVTTGTGYGTIDEAVRAGRKGGGYGDAFKRNMRGHEDQAVAVDKAREAIGNIVEQRRQEYQANMRAIKADQTPINFDPIVNSFNEVYDSAFHNGHQRVSDQAVAKLQKIGGILEEWQKDPSSHTAGGLDALKQRIDQEMPSFTEAGNAERIVTAVRNAVKDQIVKQAPQYADAMKVYEDSKAIQKELEKSLSLGKGASVDTALRKLQSVTRNNVNTNYGSRVKGVRTLEANGAGDLMPSLHGQAMSSYAPRGLAGLLAGTGGVAGLAGVASGLLNPIGLAGLAAASPRLVGEAAYLTGAAQRGLRRVSKPTKKGLLGSRAAGSVGLLGPQ